RGVRGCNLWTSRRARRPPARGLRRARRCAAVRRAPPRTLALRGCVALCAARATSRGLDRASPRAPAHPTAGDRAAVVRSDDRPPRRRLRRACNLLPLLRRPPRAVARGTGAPSLVPGRRILPVERRAPRRDGARRNLVAEVEAGAPGRAPGGPPGFRLPPLRPRA